MMAYRLRDETSSRANVRRNRPMRFAHQPVLAVLQQRAVGGQHGLHARRRVFSSQQPQLQFVRPQHQDGVIELARHRQRPPAIARDVNFVQRRRLFAFGARTVSVAVRAARSNVTSTYW